MLHCFLICSDNILHNAAQGKPSQAHCLPTVPTSPLLHRRLWRGKLLHHVFPAYHRKHWSRVLSLAENHTQRCGPCWLNKENCVTLAFHYELSRAKHSGKTFRINIFVQYECLFVVISTRCFRSMGVCAVLWVSVYVVIFRFGGSFPIEWYCNGILEILKTA